MTKCFKIIKIMFVLFVGFLLIGCEEAKFTLEFNLDGGLVEGLTDSKISIAQKAENKEVNIPIPVKNGYNFLGWYLKGELFEEKIITLDRDITLEAKWEIITYQIGYLLNGGKIDNKIESYTCEDEFELPIPVKTGYKFMGWNGELTKIEKGSTGDLMLKAVWEIEEFDIVYELDGGTLEKPINKFTYNDEVELAEPSKTGYIFKGWYDNPDFSGDIVRKINKGTLTDITLYAKWLSEEESFEIDYEPNGGTLSEDASFNYEIGVEYFLPIPEKDDCLFIGWYETSDLSGKKVEKITVSDTGNKKYYASWVELETIFNSLVPEKVTSNIELYKVHPEDSSMTISWKSLNPDLIDNEGYIMPGHKTLSASLEMTVSQNGATGKYVGKIEVGPTNFEDLTIGNTLVGYVYSGTYSRWGSSKFEDVFSLTAINALDVVNYGFATINAAGNLTIENNGFDRYLSEVLKLRKYGVRVLLCIGENSKRFSDMASTDAGIKKFVSQVLEIVEKYHFDGVDIDWEFPGVDTGRDVAVDRPNFTKLIKALREELDKHQEKGGNPYLLTAAIPGTSWGSERYEMNILDEYLDYVNMMSYDLNNASMACHHSNLYTSDKAKAYGFSIDYGVNRFVSLGFDKNKIVAGMAFYGKYYKDAGGLGYEAKFSKNIHYSVISKTYLTNSDFEQLWDDVACAPYLYNKKTKEFISYDSTRSIAEKCKYSKESGIMGVMFWDYSEDITGELIEAAYNELK
ncbi:MAG: InlB B-repeat-containing protein [Bacilli bacterium]|nr:InlB B-repeat-containing protein [Bacilli bacterium]